MPSATHMQIFSLLACRSAGFLFRGFWPPGPPPWLFSPNAPTGCHSHVLRYPHANFQPPSMSFGWIFSFGPLAAHLAFFTKRTRRLPFPCHQLPTSNSSASEHVVRLDFYFGGFGPLARPLGFFRKTHPQVVFPMPSATHMQIFSFLGFRSAGFLFWGFWPPGPPPWLFSQNAPAGCHSHAISYPHANFQLPSMSFGWIFILEVLAPWPAPLTFLQKFFWFLSLEYPPPPTCKFSAS